MMSFGWSTRIQSCRFARKPPFMVIDNFLIFFKFKKWSTIGLSLNLEYIKLVKLKPRLASVLQLYYIYYFFHLQYCIFIKKLQQVLGTIRFSTIDSGEPGNRLPTHRRIQILYIILYQSSCFIGPRCSSPN